MMVRKADLADVRASLPITVQLQARTELGPALDEAMTALAGALRVDRLTRKPRSKGHHNVRGHRLGRQPVLRGRRRVAGGSSLLDSFCRLVCVWSSTSARGTDAPCTSPRPSGRRAMSQSSGARSSRCAHLHRSEPQGLHACLTPSPSTLRSATGPP